MNKVFKTPKHIIEDVLTLYEYTEREFWSITIPYFDLESTFLHGFVSEKQAKKVLKQLR